MTQIMKHKFLKKSLKCILCVSLAAMMTVGVAGCRQKESGEIPLVVLDIPGAGGNSENSSEAGTPAEEGSSERIPPAKLDAASEEKIKSSLREMIKAYYQDTSSEKVDECLEEIAQIDEGRAALWRGIMDYWTYANEEMVVNTEKLPDDLPQDDSLCIMVLGFELNADGSMQDELLGRLNVALKCANQYPNAYVLCTGGGTAAKNPNVTEADLMGEWLVSQGLDENRLIIENKSMSTAQNAVNSYAILLDRYPQIKSLALVSSSYHIPWGSLLLESAFRRAAYEKATPEVHVVSNCAYPCTNEKYADTFRFETGGMLQFVGEEDLAMQYYWGTVQ